MYNKILVPLDGSKFSESSLEHVKTIATGCKTREVILLKVVEPLRGSYSTIAEEIQAQSDTKAVDLSREYLSRIAADLNKDGINTKAEILKGDPASEILDYSNKNSVDLIIMATRGESGVVRWLLGSVSERVVLHASVPIITVSPRGLKRGK
jgi:nucleotide-binding universal stress UspA family protein